jgi:hypothetical protein
MRNLVTLNPEKDSSYEHYFAKRIISLGVLSILIMELSLKYPIVSPLIKSVTQHLARDIRIISPAISSQISKDPHFRIDFG